MTICSTPDKRSAPEVVRGCLSIRLAAPYHEDKEEEKQKDEHDEDHNMLHV